MSLMVCTLDNVTPLLRLRPSKAPPYPPWIALMLEFEERHAVNGLALAHTRHPILHEWVATTQLDIIAPDPYKLGSDCPILHGTIFKREKNHTFGPKCLDYPSLCLESHEEATLPQPKHLAFFV
ncbi:hypothetical protein V6N11_000142 [Hibiscus sabdariffa]|uniref:Uncharacterized protein n=2 Tax=Hibiscus sabdariffa TaxID=183260 RepID=A0ABR2NNR1_9ROSI